MRMDNISEAGGMQGEENESRRKKANTATGAHVSVSPHLSRRVVLWL